jgi:energy-coupling factor transport system ATP-binding protein
MAYVSLKNVSFSYDKKTKVIKNISLDIEKGEYIAIIGHNGSGKSTLAKLFNALILPDEGEVIVDNFNSKDKKALFEIRKRVGVVFQNPDNQLVASSVEDDVAFGPENLGYPREEIKERIDFALSSVNMQKYRKSMASRLSGGQKQRVAVAGMLAIKPDVLILDESTAMLDPKGRKDLLSVAKKLNQDGMTIITITHYMEEVLFADKVYIVNDGEIVKSGTPREIFSSPEEIKALNLELPLPVYLADKIKLELGVNLGDILNQDELTEALCKL